MLVQKTLNMANGTGYVVPLSTGVAFGSVQLRAGVACYVKTVAYSAIDPAPSAPVATPAPASGATADYYHMAASETIRIGYEAPMGAVKFKDIVETSYTDTIQYLVVWSEGAGDLVINAH